MSQTAKIRHQIDALIDSGETNKTNIYTKIVDKTGLPRPTVRRIASEYKKEIEKKIRILTNSITVIEKKENDPYYFIPTTIKNYWKKKNITQYDLVRIRCLICKNDVGFLEGNCEGSIICPICKSKFPKEKKT